jgi:hypothetical protein
MFRLLPPFGGDQRSVAEIVNGIMNGKTNNTGIVTLATGNATSTTITDARIGVDSIILLVPNSAAAFADTAPYGAFQSLVDQTIASTTTAYAMTLDTTDYTNGVYLSNSSRMNVRNAGIYNLQWSGQFENSDTADHDVYVWLRKNGTDLVASTGLISVPGRHGSINGHTIGGWNFFIELAANDYIELYWSADSTTVSLQFYAAGTSPTKPSTASLITTMQYVAPNAMDNVYISSQTNGSAVISHFANSTASKTYKYVIVG